MSPAQALHAALERSLGSAPGGPLGIAVSGGGDSVALLILLGDWARDRGITLRAATVDHGLRPEAAAEAAQVGQLCADLGVSHDVLVWASAQQAAGNLQDAARRARLRLLSDWARANALQAVALGHTCDDQAETVLMRLARGAGVDGLSAMAPARRAHGVLWLRPLLDVRRSALRQFLRTRAVPWVEDPLNEEVRFLRVRARKALAALAPVGIGVADLAAVATRMATARCALDVAVRDALARSSVIEGGDVVIEPVGFMGLPDEIRARMLGVVLRWVGGGEYAPRRAALERVMARIGTGRDCTLAGCIVRHRAGQVRVGREWRAVRDVQADVDAFFDGRWRLVAPQGARTTGLHVAPLGPDGLSGCPGWRATGLSRSTLMAAPAVWSGPWLVAAPLAGLADGWRIELDPAEPSALLG
ncbi:MAG: tRNA lysidine(34) synthetase TilS [Alkalilacustris sp.]